MLVQIFFGRNRNLFSESVIKDIFKNYNRKIVKNKKLPAFDGLKIIYNVK
ncbi:hypothetical protein TRIP_D380011 [uncultured Paludibacter sp.]|nr:hypothetical protein TRIP_D380011 [uncultured Paludibacter sp.]